MNADQGDKVCPGSHMPPSRFLARNESEDDRPRGVCSYCNRRIVVLPTNGLARHFLPETLKRRWS